MIYNNIIYFLAVAFVISVSTAPDQTWLSPWLGVPLFALLLFAFSLIAKKLFSPNRVISSQQYFAAEKKASLLATALYISSFFTCDLKYYTQPLSWDNTWPTLTNLFSLLLFFVFLTLMWLRALPRYQRIFHSSVSRLDFVCNNIRTNLTIILPWLILSFFFDLLNTVPVTGMTKWLNGIWVELFVFVAFLALLAIFFPPLILRLWGCRPMEPGPLRESIERFFRRQNFSAKIFYWPLFEGRIVTAGVMGFVARYRYLLLTPALLSTLEQEELEAVLAHEIGHVKHYHFVLYLFLFLGFSLLADAIFAPLYLLFLNTDWFYLVLGWSRTSIDTLLNIFVATSIFVLMLLYFRFLFGYFIRNFERQADLHVFTAQKTAFPLIRSFEKIVAMSGNIRDKKNWHHFGMGERIDFLEKCGRYPKYIRLHNWKVYGSLTAYFFLISIGTWSLHHLDTKKLSEQSQTRYAKVRFEEKIEQDPGNSQWLKLLGDVMLKRGKERAALHAYEKAIQSLPVSPELMNNLAWLLLTAEDHSLRDPVRALVLARSAARFSEQGYILDTFATALWANKRIEEAVAMTRKAAAIDQENLAYYQERLDTFQQEVWEGDILRPE